MESVSWPGSTMAAARLPILQTGARESCPQGKCVPASLPRSRLSFAPCARTPSAHVAAPLAPIRKQASSLRSAPRPRSHDDEVCCLDFSGPLLVTGSGRPAYYGPAAMVPAAAGRRAAPPRTLSLLPSPRNRYRPESSSSARRCAPLRSDAIAAHAHASRFRSNPLQYPLRSPLQSPLQSPLPSRRSSQRHSLRSPRPPPPPGVAAGRRRRF